MFIKGVGGGREPINLEVKDRETWIFGLNIQNIFSLFTATSS